ncbi:MAG: hypothetical protein M5U01_18545 [Ardenticatenaceae bacterium]|nr:hypothetical protein [Ardenticatenaceae bacterium]
MTLPGFTAEAALERPSTGYRPARDRREAGAAVEPAQLVFSPTGWFLRMLFGRCTQECISGEFRRCMNDPRINCAGIPGNRPDAQADGLAMCYGAARLTCCPWTSLFLRAE